MSIPREDFVLRLRWTDPAELSSNVLDVIAVSDDETVALVGWEAHSGGAFVQAGFSVIRFTATGAIRWQSTHTLCSPATIADCGEWVLRYGAIAMDGDRFVVITTIVNFAKPSVFSSIGIGIDDGGAVAWCRSYLTTRSIGRAMGIVRLARAGEFLVASHNASETETWLYGIDRTGAQTGLEMRFEQKFVQRIRALPTQGIFVLGTSNADPKHPLGWILNIDPKSGKRAWERTYDRHDEMLLRWYDAAEGKGTVTVIGNGDKVSAPLMATLAGNSAPDVGNVRASFRPQFEDASILLNGIANFPATATSVCGVLNREAWQIAIDDAFNILWQKKYNHGGSTASLTPIFFPNAGTIVTGGQAIVPADPPRGLLVQSKAAAGSPAPLGCGEETHVTLQPADVSSKTIKSPFKDLALRGDPWHVNQAPLIELEEGCLP